MSEKGQRARMIFVAVVLALAWAGIAVRLSVLHLGENAKLRAKIAKLRTAEEKLFVGRGRIFDARGRILAMDLAVKNIGVDPSYIASNRLAEKVIAALAAPLQLEPAMIRLQLNNTDDQFAYIRKYVPVDLADQLYTQHVKGIVFEDVSRRNYPRGSLGCQVIGFANAEGIGSSGIEQRFDEYLKGIPGLRISEMDGRGTKLYAHRLTEVLPQAGADVYLTIDQYLQYHMESVLDAAMATQRAIGCWAILQRVRTGEILAMASRPGYNLNEFGKADTNQLLNRAIGYSYEPGSTFKIATIAAALDAGTVRTTQAFDCENGVWIHAGKPLRDYHPYGTLSVGDILKKSSNIGAAKIALTLGPNRLHHYLDEFGIGQKTGIQLAGEEGGILHPVQRWTGLSITRVPMGHEVMVTSLQILGVINAIANDGFLMKPQIVKKIVTAQGNVAYELKQPEALARPIKPETARLMRKLLTRVTEKGGTGEKTRFEGYTPAGKTGTSEKVIHGEYSSTANIASFVGMVPAEKPELALIVVMDEPKAAHTGGAVCAPVFREIMEKAVHYLDIPAVPAEMAWKFGDEVPAS